MTIHDLDFLTDDYLAENVREAVNPKPPKISRGRQSTFTLPLQIAERLRWTGQREWTEQTNLPNGKAVLKLMFHIRQYVKLTQPDRGTEFYVTGADKQEVTQKRLRDTNGKNDIATPGPYTLWFALKEDKKKGGRKPSAAPQPVIEPEPAIEPEEDDLGAFLSS